jgi:hypothetical protein
MSSLTDRKILLFPINGVPRPNSITRPGNVTWLTTQINQLIDQLEIEFEQLKQNTGLSPEELAEIASLESGMQAHGQAIATIQANASDQAQMLSSHSNQIEQLINRLDQLTMEVESLKSLGAKTQSFFGNDIANYASGSGSFELAIRVKFSRTGHITAIRYFKPHTEIGSHTGRIWNPTGTLLTSVSFSNETNSNWQTQNLETPFLVQPETDYLVSVNSNLITPYSSPAFEDRSKGDLVAISTAYGEIGNFPGNNTPGVSYLRDLEFVPAG